MEVIRHILNSAGSKVLFVRHTEVSQSDTTIETFSHIFASLGDLYVDTGDSLFASWNNGRTIRVPSIKAIEAFNAAQPSWQSRQERLTWINTEGEKLCGYIEFRGLPHAKTNENKLRGFECSMMVLVEADLLEQADFQMAMPCLRWKGADSDTCDENGFIIDSGIIVETNPPSPRHWIAQLEEEWKKGKHPSYHFWHIKTAENALNLPPGYVQNLEAVYANNPAMLARMVNGEYADAFEGNPVFYNYRAAEHEGEDLPWPKGAYLVRGYDQGNPRATVFSAYWIENGCEYWHDLYEIVLWDSDADRQSLQTIFATEHEFPFWNDRSICSGVLDFCDPAYMQRSGTTKIEVNNTKVDMSQLAVFQRNGIFPGMKTQSRGLQETIAIVNRLLQKRDRKGRPCYRIDIKGCPELRRAMSGGYRYPQVGEPGYGKNEPLKGPICEGLDGVADALRYSIINCMRLLTAEMEKPKDPLYKARRVRNPNPEKRR